MRNGCIITPEASGKITDAQLTCWSMEQSIQHQQACRIAQDGKKCGYTLGLVTRDEWDELELRVAQLEHRLRLVESRPRTVPPATSG